MRTIYKSMLIAVSTLAVTATAMARQGDRRNDERRRGDRGSQIDSRWESERSNRLSNRNETLVLELNDARYAGTDMTLYLKQEIKQQYPRIDLRDKLLVSVTLMAKSHQGHGSAELLVDGYSQMTKRIFGSPSEFDSPSDRSFDHVKLNSSRDSVGGTWQIALNGNLKIRRITVEMESDRGDGGFGRFREVSLGTIIADKVTSDRKVFNANVNSVAQVVIEGLSNTTDVLNVYVEYYNGDLERMYELEGQIRDGERKVAQVRGRNVAKVIVSATTRGLFGGRGKIEVLLRQRR